MKTKRLPSQSTGNRAAVPRIKAEATGKLAQAFTDAILDNNQALLIPSLVAIQEGGDDAIKIGGSIESLPMIPTITPWNDHPDRGKGLARDMRVREALEEVGQLRTFALFRSPR